MIRWFKARRWSSRLNAPDAAIRVEAVAHLLDLNPTNLRELLGGLLKDPESDVRLAAVRGLGKIGGLLASDNLPRVLADGHYLVRGEAEKILAELGTKAVGPLIAALRNANDSVRRIAAGILGRIKDARAMEPLTHALADTDPAVREVAAGALGFFGGSAIESLITALRSEDPKVRLIATGFLGGSGDSRAIAPLAALIEHNPAQSSSDHSLAATLPDSEIRPGMNRASLTASDLGEAVADALLRLSQVQPLSPSLHAKVLTIQQNAEQKRNLAAKLHSSFPDSRGSSDQGMLSSVRSVSDVEAEIRLRLRRLF